MKQDIKNTIFVMSLSRARLILILNAVRVILKDFKNSICVPGLTLSLKAGCSAFQCRFRAEGKKARIL